MKNITITLKTGTKINVHCDNFTEQEDKYVFTVSKDKVKNIEESPVDLSGTKGVRID